MYPEELKKLIEAAFAECHVEVTGDGRHFSAVVVSDAFTGKNLIARHRLVYAAFGRRFDTEAVHALSLKTYTPEQWQALQA
ncbi:MAG: BolA/IbaG family iron-sulfur metabolism protein [Gammaproteobacteria bacterium]|nr:MAG: BolA/IbaG family iron-sulfur metabolism protein [Gammaproteobacteria bacterium]